MFGISGPVDIVIGMLTVIMGKDALDFAGLGVGVESYSQSAYDTVIAIHSTVVRPVAAVVISMMAVLELARQATRIEGDRDMGVKIIAATMFKVVLLVVVASNMDLVIGAINGAVDTLMQGMMAYAPAGGGGDPVDADLVEAVREAGWLDQFALIVVLFLPWVLAALGTVIVAVMVWMRFMELYILTAFATLPMAFMALPDTKPIAIGYLRRYGAAALQGAVLILVLVVYNAAGPALVGGRLDNWDEYDSLSLWATMQFGPLILQSVALIVLVMASGKISKALVGEG